MLWLFWQKFCVYRKYATHYVAIHRVRWITCHCHAPLYHQLSFVCMTNQCICQSPAETMEALVRNVTMSPTRTHFLHIFYSFYLCRADLFFRFCLSSSDFIAYSVRWQTNACAFHVRRFAVVFVVAPLFDASVLLLWLALPFHQFHFACRVQRTSSSSFFRLCYFKWNVWYIWFHTGNHSDDPKRMI